MWVTAQTESGAKALKCSLNGVLTAVAVPVCHEASNSNISVIFFSVRRATMRPEAIQFLVHMSLAAAVAGVNTFNDDDGSIGDDPSATPMDALFEYGSSHASAETSSSSEHSNATEKWVVIIGGG